jgi:type IV secretory pathway TrbF-like protein
LPRLGSWSNDDPMQRLAQRIQSLVERDQGRLRRVAEMEAVRRAAAEELHTVCADFVTALNAVLEAPVVLLDPPEYTAASYSDNATNLIQISVHGRILQVAYAATAELISTEDFRIPYIMEGSVRAFNQEMLDKDLIEEQPLFYTMEANRNMWRYFESLTYRSGPFNRAFLVSVMERIL